MKYHTISLRRRHLMIAGLAGVTVPTAVFADEVRDASTAGGLVAGWSGGDKLVVSGRILGPDRKPLAGAMLEAWQNSATTDADGRFVLMANVPAAGRLRYRVSRNGQMLAARDLSLAAERDESGVWRAAFGLTLV